MTFDIHVFLDKPKITLDVEFPSVYCEYVLLLLVNKEYALGLWQGRIMPGGKSEQRYREKVSSVKEMPCSCQKRQMPENFMGKP